jgi:hypothetical protein
MQRMQDHDDPLLGDEKERGLRLASEKTMGEDARKRPKGRKARLDFVSKWPLGS